MKIGIFGGCFNPPHIMHKKIALSLIENHYLDKVIYVPTGNCYQKDNLVDAEDRYRMLLLMVKGNPNIIVSNYEIKNRLTYTYQTLDYFHGLYPEDEIYFICGSDNLDDIMTWKNYQYILDNYKLLTIKRNCNEIHSNFSNVVIAEVSTDNLSSTIIRKQIKNKGIEKYLDSEVLDYIKVKKLYE